MYVSPSFNYRFNLNGTHSGNGQLTVAEMQSHFTAWALLKSPLLIVRLDVQYSMNVLLISLSFRELMFVQFPDRKEFILMMLQLSTIDEQSLAVLKNEEIIAINQDPVIGTGVVPFRWGIDVSRTSRWMPSRQ